MPVNRVSFEDAELTSLGAVIGSKGPIGQLVAAAQPDMAPQVATPSGPTLTRGMA